VLEAQRSYLSFEKLFFAEMEQIVIKKKQARANQ